MSPKRIVLAEDHTIVREGLRLLLNANPDITVVGEVADGREAVRLTESLAPDLLLMDLSMPRMNGMDAIREIKKRRPDVKIIVLTVHKTEEYVMASLRAGADGYVLKDATHSELMMSIQHVLKGNRYLSPAVSDQIICGYLEGSQPGRRDSPWTALTQREREVLKLIAEGFKNKEIADELCISIKTVEKHRSNLMAKLNRHSASALTAYAIEKGLLR